MGQRANLATVGPQGYDLYYSHWCANTLTRDLFWGPLHAERFVQLQRRVDACDGWLDTVWAEGGAVIDRPQKTLFLFGGQDIAFEVPLRRLYLRLLQQVWEGWTIRWAHKGIVDLAEYLGVPRSRVIAETSAKENHDVIPLLTPPDQRDWLSCVGSFEFPEGLRLYPLNCFVEDFLLTGVNLLQASEATDGYSHLDVREWTHDFPTSGFHVNVARQTVDFWTADDSPCGVERVRRRWPDWNVTWHQDRFESQLALTNHRLKFPEPAVMELAGRLITQLDCKSRPIDLLEIATLLAEKEGSTVSINPYALRDDRLNLDADARKAILRHAFAQLGLAVTC